MYSPSPFLSQKYAILHIMWIWSQATGELFHNNTLKGKGYSGKGAGKNNPALQHLREADSPGDHAGPIPAGVYKLGRPSSKIGPFTIPLIPDPGNDMLGRDGFYIHGDSIAHPGLASIGCPVLSRPLRESIADSSDSLFVVLPSYSPIPRGALAAFVPSPPS